MNFLSINPTTLLQMRWYGWWLMGAGCKGGGGGFTWVYTRELGTLIGYYSIIINILNGIWYKGIQIVKEASVIVYAHGRRLCSNWVRHGSTTISYPQCSLTFMRECYLHRSFAYAESAVGIDVVSVHRLFTYRVVSTVSTDIVSSHTKYCRIAYGITR